MCVTPVDGNICVSQLHKTVTSYKCCFQSANRLFHDYAATSHFIDTQSNSTPDNNNNNNKLNTAMCFLTSRCRYILHSRPSRACNSTSHRSKCHKTPHVISVFILVTLPFHWLRVHGRSSEPQVSLEQKKKCFRLLKIFIIPLMHWRGRSG